jgi:hypothetical protein
MMAFSVAFSTGNTFGRFIAPPETGGLEKPVQKAEDFRAPHCQFFYTHWKKSIAKPASHLFLIDLLIVEQTLLKQRKTELETRATRSDPGRA